MSASLVGSEMCIRDSPLRGAPSILHMNFSFMRFETMSRPASYPVKAKSAPRTTHRASSSAL
eukprot:12238189-Alexandrium_andersonii.AAC.1